MKKRKLRRRRPTTVLSARRSEGCSECDTTLRWRTASSTKPHSLPDYGFDLKVTGVSTAKCSDCGTEHAVVGNAHRFRESILEQILKRPGALTADEIVFIRKHLKLTGGKFASLVGVSREHVSHIEQGHAPSLGTAADRLARLMIASRSDPSLKLLKRVLASLDEDIGTRSRRRAVRHPGYRVAVGSKRG